MATLIMRFVCEVINLAHYLKYYVTTRYTMKTDKYTSIMNGTTVFVKGYSASVRMHVEMPNAPPFCPYHQQITPNYSPINRLL